MHNPVAFSFVSQLTIGYGNIAPTSWLRLLVVLQGLGALVVLVLLLGRLITALPAIDEARKQPADKVNDIAKLAAELRRVSDELMGHSENDGSGFD